MARYLSSYNMLYIIKLSGSTVFKLCVLLYLPIWQRAPRTNGTTICNIGFYLFWKLWDEQT